VTGQVLTPVDQWSEFVWACKATWRELPAIVAVSLAWVLAAVPLMVAAAIDVEPALTALAGLPLALATTATVGALAHASEGGSVRLDLRASSDPTLGLLLWAWAAAVTWFVGQGSIGLVVASILGASGGLVLPLALCYGAVRDRRGLAALRGGAIIAVLRPGAALTISCGLCLAAFVCIATIGALVVVAPGLVGMAACRMVRRMVVPASAIAP
jgi:hypothetical protein